MPLSDEQYRKGKLKMRDAMLRLARWQLRSMRNRFIGSPRAYRFDKQFRAFKALFNEITPEKYKTLDAAQQDGALRGAERWCAREERLFRRRRVLRSSKEPVGVNLQPRKPRRTRRCDGPP
jgi:hypothetical protein